MTRRTLLDTGPLVAFLNRRDRHHRWARLRLGEETTPLWTCEAVVSEACFLLRGTREGPRAVLELLARGAIRVAFRLEDHLAEVARLMARYASVPMSLADACLVRMAEQHPDSRVLTADRDFTLYRKHGRHAIPTVMPDHSGA
ncbi:MAG: type II toxin-antitoxin system VapC family toxin [Candidatus Rokuibacteriota bacterium]